MNWLRTSASTWETADGRGMVCGRPEDREPYFTLHWRPGPHIRRWQEVYSPGGRRTYRRSLEAGQKAVEVKLAAIDAHHYRKEAA